MPKQNALQRIDSHEKLCRIMQRETHKKIQKIEERIKRLEKVVLVSAGALISSMAFVIYTLLEKLI